MGNFILETLRVAHVSVCGDVSTLSDAVGKGKSKPIFLFDIWPPWDFLAWWKRLAKLHVSELWTHWKICREFRMPYQQKCFLRSKVLLSQAFSKSTVCCVTVSVWNRLIVQWKKSQPGKMPGLGRGLRFCVCIDASAAIVQCVFMFIYLPLSLPLSVEPQQS